METISNVAEVVKKTIWGETTTQGNETAGTEPISGQQGKGTVNEPFDQGNAENPTTSTTASTTEPATTSNPTSSAKTETMSTIPPNTNNAAAGGAPNPLSDTDKTGVTSSMEQSNKGSDIIPSESQHPGVPPTSGATTEQKQQGADRPAEAPATEKKEEAEDFMKTRDPNDHSGEPMKIHDGSESKKIPETQEERRDSKIGLPGGQEHGKAPKGTGEEWVKTSGMAADGGDFDATKPGAGREAERLLEEKGIHKSGSNTGPPEDLRGGSPSSGEHKEKTKLSEKIKTKLHIGHKDK